MTAADRPRFTLIVATSADGFIAREAGHTPADWSSAEEAARFREDLKLGDWQIMGRTTHELAPSATRRRIVFSTTRAGWVRPTQLWLDPRGETPAGLARQVDEVHPLRHGLILGGTGVHDWFLERGAIDALHLTVEPVRFGDGLPIFSGQAPGDPVAALGRFGFRPGDRERLNDQGSFWMRLLPE